MEEKVISTIRGQVYELLKKRILEGEYAPGQWLQEKELAQQFSVSRSPVREALRQLASEGYLVDVPNKGMFVRVLTERDLEEIFDLRVLLENHALELAGRRLQKEDAETLRSCLTMMEAAHQAGDLKGYVELDQKLHTFFFTLGGNTLLTSTYERLCVSFHQFRVYSLLDKQRQQDSVAEHRRIVESLIQGDLADAQHTNRSHLELAKRGILAHLQNVTPQDRSK